MRSIRNVSSAALVAGLVASFSAYESAKAPLQASASYVARDECAGSHGAYFLDDWYDPGLICQVALSGGDYFLIANTIDAWASVCSTEADWLMDGGMGRIVEWTGNYETGYTWNAWTDGFTVGIQWPYMGDYYLLAHEGAHGAWGANENQAQIRGWLCTGFLY